MTKHRIVIVGAGFGGMFCAKGLKDAEVEITLIDRQNHHLFQPLLYQVATGFLGINDVAFPIRSMFRDQPNVNVVMDDIIAVDRDRKMVRSGNHQYPYDTLVLATGSRYSFFGRDEWQEHTSTLKTLDQAITLRQQILVSFEKAELAETEEERNRLLTYVVVGGGPTGIEMAGAIADMADYALEREFRKIRKEHIRILLLEAAPRLLGAMAPKLSEYAADTLVQKGITIQCNKAVERIEPGVVITADERIESDVIVWAAGVQANPVASWLDVPAGRNGRVDVMENLSLAGNPDIFVLGDAACAMQKGKPLPALASVAKQQGKYMAKLLSARVKGEAFTKKFRYVDLGTMATIGRNAAVMQTGMIKMSGLFAWLIWGVVHIMFLTGFRNRMTVFVTWVWTYLTYGMGARIILRNMKSETCGEWTLQIPARDQDNGSLPFQFQEKNLG